MRSIQFDEEILNQVKKSVLSVLHEACDDKKKTGGQMKTKKEIRGKNISGGIIRGMKGALLGKRSDSVKSIETTDGETEGDGFSGKGGSGGSGNSCWRGGSGCCSWQAGCNPQGPSNLNNLAVYDICPVKAKYLSQAVGGGPLGRLGSKRQGKCARGK